MVAVFAIFNFLASLAALPDGIAFSALMLATIVVVRNWVPECVNASGVLGLLAALVIIVAGDTHTRAPFAISQVRATTTALEIVRRQSSAAGLQIACQSERIEDLGLPRVRIADPFSPETMFGVRSIDGNCMLYSIGPDRDDDNGRELSPEALRRAAGFAGISICAPRFLCLPMARLVAPAAFDVPDGDIVVEVARKLSKFDAQRTDKEV